MSNGNHGLRFDIYERVHLPENVAAIDELEEIELVPRIQVIEQGENAVLQGQLVLNGIYRAQGERDEQVALEHWIPVEITLPMNRVTRLDEITVDIDTFDVVLLSSRALNLTGILSLRGIVLEQDEEADGWNAEVFTVSHSRGEEESAEYSAADFQGQTEQQVETEYQNETDYLNQSAYQGEAAYRGEEVYHVSAEQQSEAYYYAEAEAESEQQTETFHVYAYAEQAESQQFAAQPEQHGYEAEGYRNEQQEEQLDAHYAAQPEQQHYSFLQQLGQKYAQSAEELHAQGEQAEYLHRAAEYNIEQQGSIETAQYEQHEHIEAAYSEAEHHAAYAREEEQEQHAQYAREEEQDPYAQEASDTAHTPEHDAVQWSAWEAAVEEQAEREQEQEVNEELEAEELESQHVHHAEPTAERELHIALNGNTAQNETQGIRTILNSSLREQAAQQAATLQQQELDRKQAEEEKQRTTDDEIEWQQLFLNKRPEQNEFKRIRMCIVQKEDTLEQIALRYSINPRDLLIRNNLHESAITEGQLLYIP
ncbi:hypothetical protein J40TS1_25700 [Paenibacillus montaniterrae]|uniref:LysM domain-containing protein n=1 Tax=Paenibacillus montaniterrae TaxID=429341 RepID=A0A920CZ00_9BACL|nr:LysM peptidoglycan-binding domain-containing protein [Paenibacillus montaniterrae]GIP16928.1 hypothetical protein J40TS1_25700 [Paenibacillus montaniterrae]